MNCQIEFANDDNGILCETPQWPSALTAAQPFVLTVKRSVVGTRSAVCASTTTYKSV